MCIQLKEEKIAFFVIALKYTFPKRKINVRKNWLRDHTSWASCEIGKKIECLFKILSTSCFLFSLHQSTLSILCSRIQSCMLSLMNKVDRWFASVACFVWGTKLFFPTMMTQNKFRCRLLGSIIYFLVVCFFLLNCSGLSCVTMHYNFYKVISPEALIHFCGKVFGRWRFAPR